MEPKNYIEREPRMYTPGQPLVIRAEKVGVVLRVIEPLNFRLSWPAVKAGGWKEVDYPVGPVTVAEWELLVSEGMNRERE